MEIVPVGGALGAELRDADPRALDDAGFAQFLDALHTYGVVFFPEVGLSADEHMAFTRRLGRMEVFPAGLVQGATEPGFQIIEDGPDQPIAADRWHTDATWIADPPKYAVLHAELMPERGGDTMWASTTTLFDRLSPLMQDFLIGLETYNDSEHFIAGFLEKVESRFEPEQLEVFATRLREMFPPVMHPLVLRIPETGRRSLYLGGDVMSKIVGLHADESAAVIAFLRSRVEDPALQIRWRWSPGDLAVWDERQTNHRNSGDYWPQRRIIRRTEVRGEPLIAA